MNTKKFLAQDNNFFSQRLIMDNPKRYALQIAFDAGVVKQTDSYIELEFQDNLSRYTQHCLVEYEKLKQSYIYSKLPTDILVEVHQQATKELISRGVRL